MNFKSRKEQSLTFIAVDSPEKKVSSEKKLILPTNELQQVFEALRINPIDPPTPMIDFTLENLTGEKVDTGVFRGKFLWVNFWARRCDPCVHEMPSMQRLWEKFGGTNFILLAVNVREKKSRVHSFVENTHLTFPVVLDRKAEVFAKYGGRFLPSHLFINPAGEIIGVAIGEREWDNEKLHKFLQKLSTAGQKS